MLVVATLGYVWAMYWLGFFVTTAVFLAGTMWLLGNARPWLYVPIAVLSAAAVTLVLDRLLSITVPAFPYATLPLGF
jgi:lipoprotein signal peptidase